MMKLYALFLNNGNTIILDSSLNGKYKNHEIHSNVQRIFQIMSDRSSLGTELHVFLLNVPIYILHAYYCVHGIPVKK